MQSGAVQFADHADVVPILACLTNRQNTGSNIGVPVQVFGRRMKRNVSAKIQGFRHRRRCTSTICNQLGTGGVGDVCSSLNIGHFPVGIVRGFDPDKGGFLGGNCTF